MIRFTLYKQELVTPELTPMLRRFIEAELMLEGDGTVDDGLTFEQLRETAMHKRGGPIIAGEINRHIMEHGDLRVVRDLPF